MKTVQTVLIAVAVWFVSNWSWDAITANSNTDVAGGSNGAGDGSGADGSGGAGSGGSGGAGGAGGGAGEADYTALAGAIEDLAAGVRLPNLQTVCKTLSAGTTNLVAAEGTKRVCVLAYAVTAAGALDTQWLSGASILWQVNTDAPAGKSGANLSTAWPGYLFATSGGSGLDCNVSAGAVVSVTFWQE